jgi:hypothetical protein
LAGAVWLCGLCYCALLVCVCVFVVTICCVLCELVVGWGT